MKIEIDVLSGLEVAKDFETFEKCLMNFLSELGLEAKIINHTTGNEVIVFPTQFCPECGHPLKTIEVEEFGKKLYFDVKLGKYSYKDKETESRQIYRCTKCGKVIGELKSNGDLWGFIPEIE